MKYRLLIVGLLLALVAFGYWLSGTDALSFANLKVCANVLRCYVAAHYLFAVFAFCGFYILSIALSMPWAAIMTLTGGYLFGMVGMAYVIFSGVIGGTIAFLIARYVLGEYIQRHWGHYVQQFNDEIDKHGGLYLFVVRLIPVFPFCVVNSLAGLTTIGLRVFWASTFFGMIPTTAIFTYAGTQLARLTCVWDVFSWSVILSLAILAFGGIIVLRIKQKLYPQG